MPYPCVESPDFMGGATELWQATCNSVMAVKPLKTDISSGEFLLHALLFFISVIFDDPFINTL